LHPIEAKKPRLASEVDAMETADGSLTPEQDEPSSSKSKPKDKTRETGGIFTEHPYTFLPPDDPILINCMLVIFFSLDSFPFLFCLILSVSWRLIFNVSEKI